MFFFLAQDTIDRLLSRTLNWPTSHMTGCNTTNLAVFPMIYLLRLAARTEISGLMPINFKDSLAVDFVTVLET